MGLNINAQILFGVIANTCVGKICFQMLPIVRETAHYGPVTACKDSIADSKDNRCGRLFHHVTSREGKLVSLLSLNLSFCVVKNNVQFPQQQLHIICAPA